MKDGVRCAGISSCARFMADWRKIFRNGFSPLRQPKLEGEETVGRVSILALIGILLLSPLAWGADASQLDPGEIEDWTYEDGIVVAQMEGSVSEKAPTSEMTDEAAKMAKMAEAMNNPLGHLWMLFMQNDTIWYDGDALDLLDKDARVFNTFLFQPVLPMQLTEEWKWIFRPTIPINSFDVPDGVTISTGSPSGEFPLNIDFERETGLGDIVLWNVLSKNEWAKPPFVFGFGPTLMMDTATDDALGTGKWSAGPIILALKLGEKWDYGINAQHWWSFGGGGNRDDVNLTDIQYILRYHLTPTTNIGMAPNIRINWEAESGEELTLPVGGGFDHLFKIGPLPIKIGVEAYYYAKTSDPVGPEWQIRIFAVPIIPAPAFAKVPLLGFLSDF